MDEHGEAIMINKPGTEKYHIRSSICRTKQNSKKQ
jgi:hypothetical protein